MDERPNDKMLERTLLFVTLSIGILWFHNYMTARNRPPAQKPAEQAEKAGPAEVPGEVADAETKVEAGSDAEVKHVEADSDAEAKDVEPVEEAQPTQFVTLGSVDPASPYRMLITLTNRGAALVRAELSSRRYPNIEDRSGYMGHVIADSDAATKTCVVQVVGAGTPAAKAGMKPGDVITSVNGDPVTNARSLTLALVLTKPGQTIPVEVLRDGKPLNLQIELTRRPMEVIQPEGDDPLSFLVTLHQVDDAMLADMDPEKYAEVRKDRDEEIVPRDPLVNAELEGVSLRTANWELVSNTETEAVFRRMSRGLELTKTYRIAQASIEGEEDADYPAYHLRLSVAICNKGSEAHKVAYQLDGPTGLPTEGAWYANKVGPGWGLYGLRDVLISLNGKTPSVKRCADISKDELGTLIQSDEDRLTYIGVDAQYFSSILIPQREGDVGAWFSRSHPIRVGEFNKKRPKLTNTSCRLVSVPKTLEPDDELIQSFDVFTGPKRPPLLQEYGLRDSVCYGWFWWVAIPMQYVLHFFESYIVFNYGLAIILLTVVVRSCMYPVSRKQALGAQKMQELQPELKAISEKYKKDPEALRHAQMELFRKHNYHPLSGCLPVFFQLPVFIGLYRALMVDVELRGASLLGQGIRWCSNLAAPDMLFYWGSFWDRIGWESFNTGRGVFALGPYFNILPLVTIAFFIIQQKMFMPPPTDDQAKMQQNMMTFMMMFMGLLFFKVASGLCLYFIASSIWGVAEKQLLPKKKEGSGGAAVTSIPTPPPRDSVGQRKPPKRPSQKKRKR